MELNKINLIKDDLKNNPNLNKIFWTRVFYVKPLNETKEIYLCINDITDLDDCFEDNILNIRIIAWNTHTSPDKMKEYLELLESEIIWLWKLWYSKVSKNKPYFKGINEDWRQEVSRDYFLI